MSKTEKKYSWRKLFNDLHLWLGIASGLVLFVVCLSGTIYTFHHEVEEWMEPEKFYVKAEEGKAPLVPEALIEKVEQETGGKAVSISIPEGSDRAYAVSIKKSAEERRGITYFVDPYTGTTLGSSGGPVSEFFMVMMRLHRWLLIEGDVGKMIVGVSTIIFAFLVLTGLVLWWPKKLKNWKKGLKVKTDANWKRINHDLHNTLGFYSFILLLIMSLTGLCWSFGWYREGLSAVMGVEVFGGRKEKPLHSQVPAEGELPEKLSLSEVIQRSNKILSYEGNYRISIPDQPDAAFVVYKTTNGFFALSAADKLQLDQYSGKPLKVDKFADKAFNEQVVASIRPLHTGEILGTFSKILYFVACLIATSLPVTGTIIWINKLKKKSGKKSGNKKMKSVKEHGKVEIA